MDNIEVLNTIKGELIPYWMEYHINASKSNFTKSVAGVVPEISSSFMCRHATMMLYKLLKSVGDKSYKIVGGYMYANDSIKSDVLDLYSKISDFKGIKIKHYWLENNTHIIDITADQLGHEGITYALKEDVLMKKRYQKLDDECSIGKIIGVSFMVNKWLSLINKDVVSNWKLEGSITIKNKNKIVL